MAANWQRGVLRLMRVTNHPVEVVGIEDLTPWYRRIRFQAMEVVEAVDPFPTLWLRLWVPDPRSGKLVQRGYTFVTIDTADGGFTLDFVLHDTSGPAGDWAKNATVGTRTEVALTPARIAIPDFTTTMILAGDSTALPAINSWLDHLPEHITAQVYIADSHSDRQSLPINRDRNTTVTWLDESRDGGEPAAAIAATAVVPETAYAWAAGERRLVKALRSVFAEKFNLPRAQRFTQAYWIRGKSDR